MKLYDFKKAKKIILENKKDIKEASLGMHEDWFWTAETVWKDGKFTKNLLKIKKIGGIDGSSWATPTLNLRYNDGKERMIEVSLGKKTGTKPDFLSLGVLSQPVQDNITPLEVFEKLGL